MKANKVKDRYALLLQKMAGNLLNIFKRGIEKVLENV